jgi:hypothetical protein
MKFTPSLISILLIAACSHKVADRNPASSDASPVVRVVREVVIHPSVEDDTKWTIVRGRMPYDTKTHFERSSDRRFMDLDEQAQVETWMSLSSTFDRLGYSWRTSTTPQGFYTPYVKIPKVEGLECFTTHYGAVLDEKFDLKQIDYKYAILFNSFKPAPLSLDQKYFEVPYGEMHGDQVACRFLGEEKISLEVEYAFLSPIAARFPDKHAEEIKQIQVDPNKFEYQDNFFLQDHRFERITEVYANWKKKDFVLDRETVNFLAGTVGLYPNRLKNKLTSETTEVGYLAEVSKGSLIELYINGGATIHKGLFKHDVKFGPEESSRIKEWKEGKRMNYKDPKSTPYSFLCYIGKTKVYDSAESMFLSFNAPVAGPLSCGINLPKKYRKQVGYVEMNLTVFDAAASRLVMETFMKDEQNFSNIYSKKVEEARLKGLLDHINKIDK